jgi:hypothetical protein
LLDPRINQHAIRLDIKGRDHDGWYTMGEITVVSGRTVNRAK